MKKTYQSPKLYAIEMHHQSVLMLSIDENTTVSGNQGGWVKEQADNDDLLLSDKNLWSNEW